VTAVGLRSYGATGRQLDFATGIQAHIWVSNCVTRFSGFNPIGAQYGKLLSIELWSSRR
jgi:hypothetical protein